MSNASATPSCELTAFVEHHLGYTGTEIEAWPDSDVPAFLYRQDAAEIVGIAVDPNHKVVVVWPHGHGRGTPRVYAFWHNAGQTQGFIPIRSSAYLILGADRWRFPFTWHDGTSATRDLWIAWHHLPAIEELPHVGRVEIAEATRSGCVTM